MDNHGCDLLAFTHEHTQVYTKKATNRSIPIILDFDTVLEGWRGIRGLVSELYTLSAVNSFLASGADFCLQPKVDMKYLHI